MATVYLAQDLKHGRRVAIKVLRPDLAAVLGADRFLHEIATTANLQHPHILPLYDSGAVPSDPARPDASTLLFYVMPFVEGESLRSRLARETQLPVADAVRIATEAAAALDYAHRQGVVHRDIKPENILLHDGQALVADFGIALAMREAGGTRLTDTGVTLGTPQYMSPEQATAERDLDQRTDVYSLGAVTYEMLTGEPPHTGPNSQSVIAKLMTEPPRPPSALRRSVPPAVEAAVLKALEKLRADRWASASEFAAALGGRSDPTTHPTLPLTAVPLARGPRSRRVAALAVTAPLAIAALVFWLTRLHGRASPGAPPARVTIPLGQDVQLEQDAAPLDISNDGSEIVYLGRSAGKTALYLRPIGSFQERRLDGTEGASQPFLSPDGKWIAFFSDGKLRKVSRDGGDPIVLADAASGGDGGTWGEDGTILYALQGPTLFRISPRGGSPAAIPLHQAGGTATDEGPVAQSPLTRVRWPSLLPDGRHALVTTNNGVAVLTLGSGEVRTLFHGGRARYLPTGHLLFDQGEGRIRLAPFDPKRLEVTGEALPAFDAFRGPGGGAARFAVSATGTLVYVAGGFNRTLVLVDRNGHETPVAVPPRGYRFPRFSPDGHRVALTIDPRPSNIWVADLERGQLVRVTTTGHNIAAVWSPDGERLVFWRRGGVSWARWQSGEAPQPILPPDTVHFREVYPTDWTRDGPIIMQGIHGGRGDLATLAIGDTTLRPLSPGRGDEAQGRLSPDGHWLCFRSNLTGSDEIYVRPYPAGGTTVLVSTDGGTDARWSADGKELYFRKGRYIMAVPVRLGAVFGATGPPQVLFGGDYDFSQDDNWDVAPDGRFIMVRADPQSAGHLLVVLNWFSELRGAAR